MPGHLTTMDQFGNTVPGPAEAPRAVGAGCGRTTRPWCGRRWTRGPVLRRGRPTPPADRPRGSDVARSDLIRQGELLYLSLECGEPRPGDVQRARTGSTSAGLGQPPSLAFGGGAAPVPGHDAWPGREVGGGWRQGGWCSGCRWLQLGRGAARCGGRRATLAFRPVLESLPVPLRLTAAGGGSEHRPCCGSAESRRRPLPVPVEELKRGLAVAPVTIGAEFDFGALRQAVLQ